MGKVSVKDVKNKNKSVPLYRDIAASGGKLKTPSKYKTIVYEKEQTQNNDDDDGKDEFELDAVASRRVLKLAREQQQEIEDEENFNEVATKPRFELVHAESDGEEEVEEEDYEDEEEEVIEVDESDLNPSEVAMFEMFFKAKQGNNVPFEPINLADKVMEKMEEARRNAQFEGEDGEESEEEEDNNKPTNGVYLPPRVIEAYQKVGESLRAWKHGKLPKLFKVLPSIKNWEDLLYVTAPEMWTPNAVYEGTRLFISNLTASKAEKFVRLVLYPRFRQDIELSEDHKLNYHLYQAIKKSLYKPAAFFKGFLFLLVEDQCTVHEAMIAASVLKKTSIPVQHAAVALSWLLEQEFSPAATVFIRVLIEKKYALPYQTIDDLVFYFMKFRVITDNKFTINNEEDDGDFDIDIDITQQRKLQQSPPLPLVWHKALLAFAQRYKNDITDDQRDFLMEVVRQRGHREIGPEIRRELLAGRAKELQQQQQQLQQAAKAGKVDDDDIMSYF